MDKNRLTTSTLLIMLEHLTHDDRKLFFEQLADKDLLVKDVIQHNWTKLWEVKISTMPYGISFHHCFYANSQEDIIATLAKDATIHDIFKNYRTLGYGMHRFMIYNVQKSQQYWDSKGIAYGRTTSIDACALCDKQIIYLNYDLCQHFQVRGNWNLSTTISFDDFTYSNWIAFLTNIHKHVRDVCLSIRPLPTLG